MSDPTEKSNGKTAGEALNGLNGHGKLGDHDEDDTNEATAEPEETASSPLPPPPAAIAELCAACIRFVATKYKISLDGTPDTLSLVDQYVRDARDAMKERPESIDLVAPAIGAYLGELMRQQYGATWFAEGEYESYRLYFDNVYLTFNPIGMARESILMEEAEGWHAHLTVDPGERDLIDERLKIMPEVDEEEYYLPTTRMDVIEAVVETLRAHAEASGLGDVHFTPDDYS